LAGPHTSLKAYLLETLQRSGPITFERYMQLCLYHPDFGYYMQNRERTGVAGDYFTSSDLHPIFARLIARQAAEIWQILERPANFTWVEMGAGRGLFAQEFLAWTRSQLPDFHRVLHYTVVEPGSRARERIERRVNSAQPESVRVIASLEELDPVTGCFFSNELVDAFPVAVVTRSSGRLKEIYVAAEGETLMETLGPISDSAIAAAVARYANQLEEGHRVEVCLAATRWMRSVAEKLTRGFVVTIDYGDWAERLFTPTRPRGTLLAYRRHQASEDCYSSPGEADLTAHVNFSALVNEGTEAGLEFAGLTTQERFLMALGEESEFSELYDEGQSEAERIQARLNLKRLIYPGESDGPAGMGTIFKVLIQHRGVKAPLLTGLKFERL
jgi:SAM-dependent MidA family methyltransferase